MALGLAMSYQITGSLKVSTAKPAGVRCIQLGDDARCRIFDQPERPAVCAGLMPSAEMCGSSQAQALHYLSRLESLTQPAPRS